MISKEKDSLQAYVDRGVKERLRRIAEYSGMGSVSALTARVMEKYAAETWEKYGKAIEDEGVNVKPGH